MSYIKIHLSILTDIIKNRKLIYGLSKKDLQVRYLGSYLGIIWVFIQPLISMLIFWFVFQVGFKATPVDNFPFILWLMAGMIPWNFFSESILSATTSVVDNSYLVKKIVFPVSTLPITKIVSSLFIHLFFIVFLFIMFVIYGYLPTVYNLQVFYYMIAMILLSLGISWMTSSLVIFLKDIGQIISMILQFGFWLTPIFWSLKMVPLKYHFLIKLNPMFYIVEGYRDSFIYHKWFWVNMHQTIYFWIITFAMLVLGAIIFSRLKPHFADVL